MKKKDEMEDILNGIKKKLQSNTEQISTQTAALQLLYDQLLKNPKDISNLTLSYPPYSFLVSCLSHKTLVISEISFNYVNLF